MNIQLQLDKACDLKKRAEYLSEASKSYNEMIRLQTAYDNIYQKLVKYCACNGIDIFENYDLDEIFDYETFPIDVENYNKETQ